jgi:mono/diheme cytochrome c family protein
VSIAIKTRAVENTPAGKEASHDQCIGCHRDNLAKNKQAGPISCVGCHDADYQAGIEVVKDVPRMKRNQPDVVLVKTGEENPPDQRLDDGHASRPVRPSIP